MEQSWGMDLIRSFFATIDKAVYGLMTTIYQIILDLANATIISSDLIEDLYTRMYALLGIFMLFKVTFSFINYIINPDTFTDKAKGVQHLVKNVIIVLVMIIITPFAFDKLYEAQSAILEDNLIPNFILGVKSSSSSDKNLEGTFTMSNSCGTSGTSKTDGDYLSLVTLRPFYQLESNVEYDKIRPVYCSSDPDLTPKKYLSSDIYNATKSDIYVVDYKFFLSTIVGIVVCLILISFCFDIAVRSIKLGFLQMIAPIPILSYIDPASSKNGMFSKWLKQVGATWVSLFVRLIALFFAVLVISRIDINLEGSEHQFWVMLFIVVGALMFAKQLPKLLEELIPGLRLGGLQLNPFKKVANDAMFGKQLVGAATGAAGLAASGIAQASSNMYNFARNRQNLKKALNDPDLTDKKRNQLERELESYTTGRALGTTFGGLFGGAYRGLMSGYKTGASGKLNIFGNLEGDLKSGNTARNNRANINKYNREVDQNDALSDEQKREQKYTFFERNILERLDKNAGVKNEHGGYGYYDKEIKDLGNKLDNLNQTEQAIRNSLAQKTDYFAQLLEVNKEMKKVNNDIGKAINNIASKTGTDSTVLRAEYSKFSTVLDSLNNIDKEQKELKAKKKNYEEMMAARQEAKK